MSDRSKLQVREVDPVEPKEGEELVYDESWRDWRALAFHRDGPDSRIVIVKGDRIMVENENYPGYRIYNVAAHLRDIAEKWERENPE